MVPIDARKLILAPIILAVALTSAYADSNLFFYNKDKGSGAVTTFSRTQPPTTVSAQEFSTGWDVVTSGPDLPLFFYNSQTGLAVGADADQAGLISDYGSYHFSASWAQIIDVVLPAGGSGPTLFYNRQTGIAVSGSLDASSLFQYPSVYHFSAGWTNIVATDQGMLFFYNAVNGSGAVGYLEPVANPNCPAFSLSCPPVDMTFVQKKSYGPGALTPGWTSIVETHHGILFYRASDGLQVMADVNSQSGVLSTRSNSLKHLSTGFSSIVADPSDILFYNKSTGDVAIGHVSAGAQPLSATPVGTLSIDQSLLSHFAPGWTAVTNVVLEVPEKIH